MVYIEGEYTSVSFHNDNMVKSNGEDVSVRVCCNDMANTRMAMVLVVILIVTMWVMITMKLMIVSGII